MARSNPVPRATFRTAFGRVLRLAGPVAAIELGGFTIGLEDTLILGRLGAEAMGAVGLGNILVLTVATFGIGLMLSLDPLIAQAYGAGREDDCERWLRHGLLLGVMAAGPLAAVVWLLSRTLPLFGIEPDILGLVLPYMETSAWGIAPLLLFAATRSYLQATGIVRPITLVIIAGNVLYPALAIPLVLGWGDFPGFGTAGSAWAMLIARAGLFLALAAFLVARLRQRKDFHAQEGASPADLGRNGMGFEWARMRRIVGLGVPAAVQRTLEIGVFAVATALASLVDAPSLAAHQIVLQVSALTFVVPLGIGAAGGVLVGQAVGAGQRAEARRRGWIAIGMGLIFMGMAASTYLVLRGEIVRGFTADPAVIEIGVVLLLVVAAFQLPDGLQAVLTGALRGLGDTRTPMLANLGGYWLVGLPLGYILCFHAGLGVVGLWMGLAAGLSIIAVVLVLAWVIRTRWMTDSPDPASILGRR